MPIKLQKKKKLAFVLGGSGLIGREVIKFFLLRNIDVVNLDIVENKLNKNQHFYKFDCNKKNIKKNILKVILKFGLPNILINCSYPRSKDWTKNTFKEIKLNSLRENIDSNLVLPTFLARTIAEECVKKKKKCSIVFLSSIYGLVGQDLSIYKKTSIKENMTYSIAKGGLINFTKQMASYYSKHNIRVNCVCPGGVIDKKKLKSKAYKNFVKNYSERCPLNRLAEPSEIALPIIFLSSDDARYITGTSLIVDGGWTAI